MADILDIDLDTGRVETIGGLVLSAAGRIPASGEVIEVQGLPVTVDRVAGNRIIYVSVPVTPEQSTLVGRYLG